MGHVPRQALSDKPRLVTLTGAKQNLGDHLITSRCEALVARHLPEAEIVRVPSWESLDDHPEVEGAHAFLILGGPGYRPAMYPGVYKLMTPLSRLQAPVIPVGVGWKGRDVDPTTISRYRLSPLSIELLHGAVQSGVGLSCRDYPTWQMLRDNGFDHVTMTGCPAWYDLDSLGEGFSAPSAVRSIAFSTPAEPAFFEQTIACIDAARRVHPTCEVTACFHHGFEYRGQSGNEAFFAAQRRLREMLEAKGVPCEDFSADLAKMTRYDDYDLHVGYRVHAHIYRLSRRKPSVLLYEDARGFGVDDALGVPGVVGWSRRRVRDVLRHRIGAPPPAVSASPDAVAELEHLLRREATHGYRSFVGVGERIDAHYESMTRFLTSIGRLWRVGA